MTRPVADAVNSIVIIDDEPLVGQLIERIAGTVGFRAVSTVDPEVFRDRVRNRPPTHVMIDLQMPDADGVELMRYLAEIRSPAKVIICSGVDPRIVEHARKLGLERGLDVVATISKPVRIPELRGVLEAVCIQPWLTHARLSAAINSGNIRPAYQPQIDATTFRLRGVEALARWADAEHGAIPPGEFVPFAEDHGLMEELTQSVTRQVLEQLAIWDAAGFATSVSINLSAQNLSDLSFVDWFLDSCRGLLVDPACITFELTETAAMAELVDAMDVLTRFRLNGVGLAIDDFGTGYSSLVQLRNLPFTEVKIDRSFVMDYAESADAQAITKAIIALAQALQLRTVAEGVEAEAVAEHLRVAGCDILQGFWIARPLNADDVTGWAADWAAQCESRGRVVEPEGK